MNICFINPSQNFNSRKEIIFPQCLGLSYIAANLLAHNHNVSIIESVYEGQKSIRLQHGNFIQVGLTNPQIVERIPSNTDLIGISAQASHEAYNVHSLVSDIKKAYPNTPLILGGIYPSLQPELAIQSSADYLCVGEGEIATLELINYLEGKRPDLPDGIYGQLEKDFYPTVVENLDSLPVPARQLINFSKVLSKSPLVRPDLKTALILSSRGCPYDCSFCSLHAINQYKIRRRSPENISHEIKSLIESYQINHIEFIDNCFIFDKEFTLNLNKELIKINKITPLRWSAAPRIDSLDSDIIAAFSASNCFRLTFPVEHGSKRMLKLMNKQCDLDQVLNKAQIARKHNIKVKFLLMCGYPGENDQYFNEGLDFYRKLKENLDEAEFQIFIAQPFPRTRLYDLCQIHKYIPENTFQTIEKNYYNNTSYSTLIETPDFNPQKIATRMSILKKELSPQPFLKESIKRILSPDLCNILSRFRNQIYNKD